MKAADAKWIAEDALRYMRENEHNRATVYGYCWSALARIAGTPNLPLPCDERAAALKAAKGEA